MTQNNLRKLKRHELLELMLEQSRQIDLLKRELHAAQEQLKNREIALAECGSLAEAALRLNGVFEAAQAAADQYVAEVRRRTDA